MKRIISLVLILCLVFPRVCIAAEQPKSLWGKVGQFIGETAESAQEMAQGALGKASEAVSDVSKLAKEAWDVTSSWVSSAWETVSAWTKKAWENSYKWVCEAWGNSSEWASTNWDAFLVWANSLTAGNPYDWIEDVVLSQGILAYDSFAEVRSFLKDNPTEGELKERFAHDLSQLSLLDEDKETLWQLLEDWSKEKGLSASQTAKLSLPFLTRLLIEGEAAIGEGTEFSGPVVGQYLLNILEVMKLDSEGDEKKKKKALFSSLDDLERPTIIGDKDQNALTTDDGYYIENFTYKKGKYQVVMIVSQKEEDSAYPYFRGKNLRNTPFRVIR